MYIPVLSMRTHGVANPRWLRPASGRGVIVLAEGSGFIVSPDGVILTGAHLVDRADTVVVTLTDRRQFNTRVLGQDRESDVAVVKIDAEELPTVRLGESSSVRPSTSPPPVP
jgi:serine protease Do